MSDTQVAVRDTTVKGLLSNPAYQKRFEEILGKRAPQFMASVINVSSARHLQKCEPKTVIAAALTAATLDLPVGNFGFAHIVPYKDQAQFQLGYKGLIQLALRSGQFAAMRDAKINAEAFGGFDPITGDPVIDWSKLDETKEAVGYVFAWKLTNGFSKIVYWSREKVEAHSERFSQAVKYQKKDSPWYTDFDTMALKTVIKAALSKWAPLSIEMQRAIEHDQGVQKDVDGDILYPDNKEPEVKKPVFGKKAEPVEVEEVDTSVSIGDVIGNAPAKEEPLPPPAPKAAPAADNQADVALAIEGIENYVLDLDLTEEKCVSLAISNGWPMPARVKGLKSLPLVTLHNILDWCKVEDSKRRGA